MQIVVEMLDFEKFSTEWNLKTSGAFSKIKPAGGLEFLDILLVFVD